MHIAPNEHITETQISPHHQHPSTHNEQNTTFCNKNDAKNHYFASVNGAKYCNQRVCLSVCLYACLQIAKKHTPKLHDILQNSVRLELTERVKVRLRK